jgi:hypothetical protein
MGVFITRGMKVQIPAGGLVISSDGQSTLTLHVHFDVCPTWLEIADRHLKEANERKLARTAAWNSTDENAKAAALEREFEASMQAIMAAAIAIDSLYANLRDAVNVSNEVFAKWRANNTVRYKQISEIIRRAFTLNNRDTVNLRKAIREIFWFRDLAVHPSGDVNAPVPHDELQVEVEWRFALFRASNAEALVKLANQIVRELVEKGNPANSEVERYAQSLRERLSSLSAV